MKQKVPKCNECKYRRREPLVKGGTLRDMCYHPAWKDDVFPFMWIKSTAKRKHSPKWCPLRQKEKEAHLHDG